MKLKSTIQVLGILIVGSFLAWTILKTEPPLGNKDNEDSHEKECWPKYS